MAGIEAGGYVWHTTGSGKTLTSFKAAQLARAAGIDKVFFVVDRKDLDYQTMKEYDRFEKGAANANTSTAVLKRQLEDDEARIIVTTIQKLSLIRCPQQASTRSTIKHVVVIFDECHRSQFGDMHEEITRVFKRYHLFGFTGTPIFAENARRAATPTLRTTEQAFGDRLHTYTIVDAINDKNVLPFRIDYVNTIKAAPSIRDKKVPRHRHRTGAAVTTADRAGRGLHPEALRPEDQAQRHLPARRQAAPGFNSLFATASIDAAKRYYAEFTKQQEELPKGHRLTVGLIFSFAANEEIPDGLLAEEEFETDRLDKSSRDFLDDAIKDYNSLFDIQFRQRPKISRTTTRTSRSGSRRESSISSLWSTCSSPASMRPPSTRSGSTRICARTGSFRPTRVPIASSIR